MKRHFLMMAVALCGCLAAKSQQVIYPGTSGTRDNSFQLKPESRFSLNLHAGYSIALGSTFAFYPDDISKIQQEQTNNTITSKKTDYQAPTKGLGQGFRFGGGISYILNDFLNVGLDVDYFRSTIRKVKDSFSHQIFTSGSPMERFYELKTTNSYDALLLSFTPNITFKAISRPKWFIYNKIGAVIVIRPNSIQHVVNDETIHSLGSGNIPDSASHSDLRYDWGIRNPSLGFMGGFGIQVKILEKVRVFSEIQFSHVVFEIRNRIVTDYNVDGQNKENTLPMNQREIYFRKDFETTGTSTDPSKPGEAATQRLPITYVGLQMGVVYRF